MATTTTSTIPCNYTTDAGFRTIGSAIGSALTTVGLVQTADTGQINWTTVTKPTVALVSVGYEIFRFNDSLQSTSPLYIKLEYGTGTYSTSYMTMWLTIGTGTDGAGTLTGNVSTRFYMSGANPDTSARTSYFSGGTNRICATLWPLANSAQSTQWFCFGVERTHDATGADTGTGAHIFVSSPSGLAWSQYLPLGATTTLIPPAISGGWYCSVPLSGSGVLSADTFTYPVKTWAMTESLPSLNFIEYVTTDLTNGTTVSVIGYDGNTRSYFVPGLNNYTTGYFAPTTTSTISMAMRYD